MNKPPVGKYYKAAEHQLDAVVITIEFTLISIVAGLTLTPLMDNAAPLINNLNYEFWLYILTDLVLIMFFWTVVIGHALTFVVWPVGWFSMCTFVGVVAGLLARYDLGLIEARRKSAEEPGAVRLYEAASKRQWLHIYSSIFSIITIGLATFLIYAYPDFFIRQHGHLISIGAVLAWTLLLLANEFRMFSGLRAGIVDSVAERLAIQDHANMD